MRMKRKKWKLVRYQKLLPELENILRGRLFNGISQFLKLMGVFFFQSASITFGTTTTHFSAC